MNRKRPHKPVTSLHTVMTIIILLYSFCVSLALCSAMMMAGALANIGISSVWYIVLSLSFWLIFNFTTYRRRMAARKKGKRSHAHRKADH